MDASPAESTNRDRQLPSRVACMGVVSGAQIGRRPGVERAVSYAPRERLTDAEPPRRVEALTRDPSLLLASGACRVA
jgi:hypothetical protein